MNKIGEQWKGNNASYTNKLPAEIVGRFLQNLSVGDRLKSERVLPLWKRSLTKWGWTEQKKLDEEIVFEGANDEEKIIRFWKNLNDGSCQLASLVNWCGPWLLELDLRSFGGRNIERFLPKIIETFQLLIKIEKLDIRELRLRDFVDHLPHTLCELKTSNWISIETLQALSNRCPNLEEVPFEDLENKRNQKTETLIEPIGKFPRQKKLDLHDFTLRSENEGSLASFGQLKALKELDLWYCESLDGKSLEAIVEGCQRLRSFIFDTLKLTEGDLFQLAKFPNLTVLKIFDQKGEFTNTVLMTIARQRQLKKLIFIGPDSEESLTDASIVYLIDQCKLLISLRLEYCFGITERSLHSVIAEVQRKRYGTEPGTLPTGDLDPGIFYFYCSAIVWDRALQLIAGSPWVRFVHYDPRKII